MARETAVRDLLNVFPTSVNAMQPHQRSDIGLLRAAIIILSKLQFSGSLDLHHSTPNRIV